MTAGKAPQAILRVMHNSLSESDSEGTYSIVLEPFALALALALAKCSASPSPLFCLNFALALAKPLVWPEICPRTGVAPPPGLEFALALAKPLVWPEICPSTGETPGLLEIYPSIGEAPCLA